ncbi:YjbF family lipoprotein [Celeribacter indicus]|nr:YjbF family lipoprotein [Celeribacter indicus]SDX01855.1 Group 4 capsule polysaccharide lipoprotein gfcB, YjbF [Celeribacter indicus]
MTRPRILAPLCALLLALGGCSSTNDDSVRIARRLLLGPEPVVPGPAFIALAESGAPAYIVSIEERGEAYATFLRQSVNAKGEESWISGDGLSLGMREGMVIATRGLGGDMLAGEATATRAALRAGRGGVTERFATLLDGEDHAVTLSFRCRVTPQGAAPVDLGRYTASTTFFHEDCRNGETAFRNLFWVERGTGRIVQSRQWISEGVGTLALRLIP